MAITDYKVTDAERNAVYVQAQADTLSGTAAQNKAVFDAYPELVRDNLDDLIDYIDVKPMSFESTAAAATANKGTFAGWIPDKAIIDLVMTNGNTAVSPTITIDGVAYTISGMPTKAKTTGAYAQTYKLYKSGATTLTFVTHPDYVCEWGVSGNFRFQKMASGKSSLFMNNSVSSGELTMSEISSSGIYKSTEVSITLPTGVFVNADYTAHIGIDSLSYVLAASPQYNSCTATSLKYLVLKGGSSTSEVWARASVEGVWK